MEMTSAQSGLLRLSDRVCWESSAADLGTVTHTGWSGVVINWDNGRNSSIHHNDMAQVERLPVKVS